MKSHLPLSAVVFFLWTTSCSVLKEDVYPDYSDREETFSSELTVEQARNYVESIDRRSTRSEMDDAELITLGKRTTYWNDAEQSTHETLQSLDVPTEGEYRYYLYQTDSLGEPMLSPTYHKLVVIKDSLERMDAYIRFYIPDRQHALTHPASYYETLLNSNEKTGFTGFSCYTSLTGFPYAAGRYENGSLQRQAFLGDTLHTVEENAERLIELLGNLAVARVIVPAGATRSLDNDDDTLLYPDDVDAVVVIGKPIKKTTTNVEIIHAGDLLPPLPNINPIPDDPFAGGGGAPKEDGEDGNPNKNKTSYNINIKTSSNAIVQLLDELYRDCMGHTLLDSFTEEIEIIVSDDVNYGSYNPGAQRDNNNNWLYNKPRIRINSQHITDFVLLEELIHAYQYCGKDPAIIRSYRMNNEMEAKVGWALYRKRNGNFNLEELSPFLGGRTHAEGFLEIGNMFLSNPNIHSPNFDTFDSFNQLYLNLMCGLRQNGVYSYEHYPESEDHISFPVLKEIMINCLN